MSDLKIFNVSDRMNGFEYFITPDGDDYCMCKSKLSSLSKMPKSRIYMLGVSGDLEECVKQQEAIDFLASFGYKVLKNA